MTLKQVRAKLIAINNNIVEHLDFLLEIRQDEQLYKDDIKEIGKMADDVLSALSKYSDLLESVPSAKKDWVCEKCGKSTFETDYDCLVHPTLHLGCALQEDEYGQVSQAYNRGSVE
jgi:hypothetical protein